MWPFLSVILRGCLVSYIKLLAVTGLGGIVPGVAEVNFNRAGIKKSPMCQSLELIWLKELM